MPGVAAFRAPAAADGRLFANEEEVPEPNRFPLPTPVVREALKFDLVMALRAAILFTIVGLAFRAMRSRLGGTVA